jgi:hypothetical protein
MQCQKLLCAIAILFFQSISVCLAQDKKGEKTSIKSKTYPADKSSLGIGLGLDYGGYGACFTIYPQQNIGVFGSIGYALAGLGYNVGLKARLLFNNKKPSASLFVAGMYGYNTAFKIKNLGTLNKIFYGPSLGIGLETAVKPQKAGVWAFAVYVPIRSQEALDYQEYLKSRPFLDMKNDLLPIAISIGYKFTIH